MRTWAPPSRAVRHSRSRPLGLACWPHPDRCWQDLLGPVPTTRWESRSSERARSGAHATAFLADPRVEILSIVDPDEKTGQRRVDEVAEAQGRRPRFMRDMRGHLMTLPSDSSGVVSIGARTGFKSTYTMQAKTDASSSSSSDPKRDSQKCPFTSSSLLARKMKTRNYV